MAQKLPSLNVLKVFDVAATYLSFKKASEVLCLSPSAVSHQIKVLEKQLGQPLFIRKPRALELTQAGAQYHEEVKRGLQIIEAATEQILGPESEDGITISCIPFVTNHFLIPHLSAFKQEHPDVSIKLLSQIERAELKAGHVDMAVRYQKHDDPDLTFIPLTPVRLTPICSPSYWQSFCREEKEFVDHNFISLSVDVNTWGAWLKTTGFGDAIEHFQIELDNYQAVKQAAIEGLGLAMGYWPAVQDLVESGQLIAPYENYTISYGAMYLVYPKRDEQRAAVKAVTKWITELFKSVAVDDNISPMSE